jgi:hypothetical protein
MGAGSAPCRVSKKLARAFSLSWLISPVKSKVAESRASGLTTALVASDDLWLRLCHDEMRRGGTSSVRPFRRGETRLGGGGSGRPRIGSGGVAWSDHEPLPRFEPSPCSEMMSRRSSGTSELGRAGSQSESTSLLDSTTCSAPTVWPKPTGAAPGTKSTPAFSITTLTGSGRSVDGSSGSGAWRRETLGTRRRPADLGLRRKRSDWALAVLVALRSASGECGVWLAVDAFSGEASGEGGHWSSRATRSSSVLLALLMTESERWRASSAERGGGPSAGHP